MRSRQYLPSFSQASRGALVFSVVLGAGLLAVPAAQASPAAPAREAAAVTPAVQDIEFGSLTRPTGNSTVEPGTQNGPDHAGEPALRVLRPEVAEFSSVGVTWAADPSVRDVRVSIRTRAPDRGWSAWTRLDADNDAVAPNPEAGAVRDGTSAYWTGPSSGIELEVLPTDGSPTDLRLTLIDPKRVAADSAPVATAVPVDTAGDLPMPAIYSRAAWGADENLMDWDPDYADTLIAATIHHTADTNDYDSDDVPGMLRSIYYYHSVTHGWGDIGYNMLVDKFGRIWEGRYGGLASTVIGAHAGGFNTGTVGVSMIGNYDMVEVPEAAMDAVAEAIAWKLSLYGLDPTATTRITSVGGSGTTSKYPPGTTVTVPVVFGHQEVGYTACPGRYAWARMGEFRDRIDAKMQIPVFSGRGFYLRGANAGGPADIAVAYGIAGDIPLVCDWNSDGVDTPAVFRAGWFYIRNSLTGGPAHISMQFGTAGDRPVCGDWDGDGDQTPGVFRQNGGSGPGTFYLRNGLTTGPSDLRFDYGSRGDQPVAGDWNGDSLDTVGVFRDGSWQLTDSTSNPQVTLSFGYGTVGDDALAGDWDGNGADGVGVQRGGTFYERNQAAAGPSSAVFTYGTSSDDPLAGDWDGNGTDTVGITRGY
ncbi:MAG: N-acetylmuramoyl-L-alanine amidase [Geodermatophilaceae bacterium]